MFDLVGSLKSAPDQGSIVDQEKIGTVLFYQTTECNELVLEAFRFEGIVAPAVVQNTDDEIIEHVRSSDIEIVIVELNHSDNVSADAERINHLLPNHASVIVIGSEDAISTIRNLKNIGFYYLFWPITKQELIDFVRSVHDNRRKSSRGPGQNRRAKCISIIGSKGGVGATFVCAEMAYQLSTLEKSSCLVVDQNHSTGDLDIMMGIRDYERRTVQKSDISIIDDKFSQSLVYRQNSLLSVLSLTSESVDDLTLLDYTNSVIDYLAGDFNFILEDRSASVAFSVESDRFISDSDVIVLVMSASVSAIRDAARLRDKVKRLNKNESLRLILVMNHIVPPKSETLTKEDAEAFLKQTIDIEIPFCDHLNAHILEHKRVARSSLKAAKPLRQLTATILGERANSSKKRSLFSFS
ncbi:cell division inhibitor MinD [Marinomonas aquimarina]|uniref:Cell division inhibitor MinD n=1 Tax=Marinomonas aquimarina TaxID=295068 RepID=A0A1A8T471_9GAMM|nr:hypothetical protein [Marinomonas aquimarina]SBS25902.1 cell division inhibitor MinD [Marinomonas aquimarina]